MLGRALKGRRNEAVIATKVSAKNLAPADIRAACQRSLNRLQTDVIDLYQVHWPPSRSLSLEDMMATLLDLQRQGKVRVIGVSNFGELDMPDTLSCGRYDANQLPYSLLWRAIEFTIQPQCVEHKIGILPYSPLNQALLTGRYRNADEMPYQRTRTRHFRPDRRDSRHGYTRLRDRDLRRRRSHPPNQRRYRPANGACRPRLAAAQTGCDIGPGWRPQPAAS